MHNRITKMKKFCNFDLFSVQQSAKELDYLIRESTQKVTRIKTDNTNVPIFFLASVNSCPHRLFFRIFSLLLSCYRSSMAESKYYFIFSLSSAIS